MDEILRMAREVGRAVAAHASFKNLREAEEAVKADPAAKTLVHDFDQQQERLLRLSVERQPIEPGDKRRMQELQTQVMAHPLLKRLYAAQVDFKHLMDKLNRAIQEGLGPADGDEAARAANG